MNKSVPNRAMRENPDIEQLKRQAKELLASYLAGQSDAVAEVNSHFHNADRAAFALHDAQLVLARAYGYESWPKLKAFVDGVTAGHLCEATERGDLDAIREMLARRPEIVNFEWTGHGEYTALHIAVLRRDAAMADLLMKNGADARKGIWPKREATSSMTIAAERGYDEIVSIIRAELKRRQGIHSEAATDATERDLQNAMWGRDQQRTIASLQAYPPLIQQRFVDGSTVLHKVAQLRLEDVTNWLLDNGADATATIDGIWTPLDLAAGGREKDDEDGRQSFIKIAKALRQHAAALTPISAVALGDVDWVRKEQSQVQIQSISPHNVFDLFGGLLSTAVSHEQTEMLKLLLDLGLNPDERMRIEGTEEIVYSWAMPLYLCAEAGRYGMAELLLKHGADPNGHIYVSGTPVGRAYGARDWKMVKLLEDHGGVVYAANAGYYRDADLARRLLAEEDAGRLREGAVDKGKTLALTLLESGASGGDPEIVRMALERINWPRDDVRWYWRLWDTLCFWNHMPGIPSADPSFDRRTYLECFRLILERCEPNLRPERFEQTILHEIASMRRHVTSEEVLQFATALLDKCPSNEILSIRDNLLKSTPLGWACRWGRVELVKLLLDRGADPVEAEAEPWATPTAWAEKMGHGDIVAVLQEKTR